MPYLRHFPVYRRDSGNTAHRCVPVRGNISEEIFGYQYYSHNLPVRVIDVWHDSSSDHSRGEGGGKRGDGCEGLSWYKDAQKRVRAWSVHDHFIVPNRCQMYVDCFRYCKCRAFML